MNLTQPLQIQRRRQIQRQRQQRPPEKKKQAAATDAKATAKAPRRSWQLQIQVQLLTAGAADILASWGAALRTGPASRDRFEGPRPFSRTRPRYPA